MTEAAYAALKTGKFQQAKSLFSEIDSSGKAQPPHWLGLAFASYQLVDTTTALISLDKLLEVEPYNLRALILKADCLVQSDNVKKAIEYYQYFLKLASQQAQLPPDIVQAVSRAEAFCRTQNNDYKNFLLEKLKSAGFNSTNKNSQFKQSLDLIFESRQIFYQQPRNYYYPGLPQIQFYSGDSFPWVAEIEAKTSLIQAELQQVMQHPEKFSPYVKSKDKRPGQNDQGLDDNDDWSALYLWENGQLVEENRALFPETLKALELAPMPNIHQQAPMALFSKLAGNTRIPSHNGLLNTRLICHLPLIVPANCGALRVGNESRSWVEGEMLIFDDSIEHEAWNNSDLDRVILLFEVWRPEISEAERELITVMLEAVKQYT